MGNKLLLLYYKIIEQLSLHLLANLDEYICQMTHTSSVCVCMFADLFNTTWSLSVILQNVFADLSVTHFRSC